MIYTALCTLARSTPTLRNSSRRLFLVPGIAAHSFHSTPRWTEQHYNVDRKTFDEVTKKRDKIILVDFYADWCGPCHQLSPILNKLTENSDALDLVTVDTDSGDGLELGKLYKVRALPTVIAFQNGQPINQFVGALPEPRVRAFVDELH